MGGIDHTSRGTLCCVVLCCVVCGVVLCCVVCVVCGVVWCDVVCCVVVCCGVVCQCTLLHGAYVVFFTHTHFLVHILTSSGASSSIHIH